MSILRLDEPGDHQVSVPILCVITRFGLQSARFLLPTYRDYRHVMRDLETSHIPGFLRSAFIVENPTTCYSVSLWSSWDDIPHFGTEVPYHVDAARRIFGRVRLSANNRPEIWSTKWQLASVSNNLNWDDFDLRGLIMGMSR